MVVWERAPCKGLHDGSQMRDGVRSVVLAQERHWCNGLCRILEGKGGNCGLSEQESNFLIILREILKSRCQERDFASITIRVNAIRIKREAKTARPRYHCST